MVVIVYESGLEDVVKELGNKKQICLHKFYSYLNRPQDKKYDGCDKCKYPHEKPKTCPGCESVSLSPYQVSTWP